MFGSMANRISSIVAIGSDYYAGRVVVTDTSRGLAAPAIPADLALRAILSKTTQHGE